MLDRRRLVKDVALVALGAFVSLWIRAGIVNWPIKSAGERCWEVQREMFSLGTDKRSSDLER